MKLTGWVFFCLLLSSCALLSKMEDAVSKKTVPSDQNRGDQGSSASQGSNSGDQGGSDSQEDNSDDQDGSGKKNLPPDPEFQPPPACSDIVTYNPQTNYTTISSCGAPLGQSASAPDFKDKWAYQGLTSDDKFFDNFKLAFKVSRLTPEKIYSLARREVNAIVPAAFRADSKQTYKVVSKGWVHVPEQDTHRQSLISEGWKEEAVGEDIFLSRTWEVTSTHDGNEFNQYLQNLAAKVENLREEGFKVDENTRSILVFGMFSRVIFSWDFAALYWLLPHWTGSNEKAVAQLIRGLSGVNFMQADGNIDSHRFNATIFRGWGSMGAEEKLQTLQTYMLSFALAIDNLVQSGAQLQTSSFTQAFTQALSGGKTATPAIMNEIYPPPRATRITEKTHQGKWQKNYGNHGNRSQYDVSFWLNGKNYIRIW